MQARPGQAHALLGACDSVLGDAQQARVRGVGQPCRGDVRHQREPRRASCRLGREIAVALNVGQRSQAAEQVDLERVDPDAEFISGRDALAVAARIGARPRRCVDLRQLLRALDPHLLPRCGNVCGGDHQVPIVDQRLLDEPLQPGILEDVAIGHRGERSLRLPEVSVALGP